MANSIKIKRSSVQGKVPTTNDLQLGELAINTYDGKLYTKKSVSGVDTVVEISGGAGSSYTASTTAPGSPSPGDSWLDTSSGILYLYVNDGDSSAWVELGSTGIGSSSSISDGDKGDITVGSSGASWTIDSGAVTYAKIQNVSATDKLLGRSTAGAGSVEEITCTSAGRALLDDVDAAAQRTTLGLGGSSTLNVGTSAGTVAAGNDTRFTYGVSYNPTGRLITIDNGSTVSSASLPLNGSTDVGFVPASGGGTTNFYRADGTWAKPPTGWSSYFVDSNVVTVANTTAESTLFTYTLPASPATNTVVHVHLFGEYLNNSGANRTIRFQWKIGSTVIINTAVSGSIATSATLREWESQATLLISGTNSQRLYATGHINGLNVWGAPTAEYDTYATASVDLSTAQELNLTVFHSATGTTTVIDRDFLKIDLFSP